MPAQKEIVEEIQQDPPIVESKTELLLTPQTEGMKAVQAASLKLIDAPE